LYTRRNQKSTATKELRKQGIEAVRKKDDRKREKKEESKN
jgi:hypothetical protein